MWTCKRGPYGYTQRLRPVNASAYICNNVSSIHAFPCLFNSTIHTALAVLLQTRLQASTSISCCTPSSCAQSREGVSGLDTGPANNFRAHTFGEVVQSSPVSLWQAKKAIPLFSSPRTREPICWPDLSFL